MRVFVNFRPEITDPGVAERFKGLLLASNAFDDVAMSPDRRASPGDAAAEIARCDAFIAIIGPGWAERRDAEGRLIDNPRDPIRLEITTALDRIMPMVPVLLDGATLPDASAITPALQGLALRDSVAVNLASLDADFPRLLAAIAPGYRPRATDPGGDTRTAVYKPPRSRSAAGLPAAASLHVVGTPDRHADGTVGPMTRPIRSNPDQRRERKLPRADIDVLRRGAPERGDPEAPPWPEPPDSNGKPRRAAEPVPSGHADAQRQPSTPADHGSAVPHPWMLLGVVGLGMLAAWIFLDVMNTEIAILRTLIMSDL